MQSIDSEDISNPVAESAIEIPLGKRLSAVLGDIQFAHTVFALPFALASAHLAFLSIGGYKLNTLIVILICMVSARTMAMSFNRYLDCQLDSENPRTMNRSIPSGRARPIDALLVAIVCALVFITACWYLGPWPLGLSLPTIAFLLGYSQAKKFTVLTHIWLGWALAIAPVGAWIAITGSWSMLPIILSFAVSAWVAGFDVIYSLQDIEFDKGHGVYSIPARFGVVKALWISRGFHVFSLAMLYTFGFASHLSWPFLAVLAIVGIGLLIEHLMVKPDDFSRVGIAFFTMNGIISILIYVGVLVSASPVIAIAQRGGN
jgi:4-hydroxybenzoate polyprenyltransferase